MMIVFFIPAEPPVATTSGGTTGPSASGSIVGPVIGAIFGVLAAVLIIIVVIIVVVIVLRYVHILLLVFPHGVTCYSVITLVVYSYIIIGAVDHLIRPSIVQRQPRTLLFHSNQRVTLKT